MDNYIYYRILDYLAEHNNSTKSELVSAGRTSWLDVLSILYYLEERDFIKRTQEHFITSYNITPKGKELHLKLKEFYVKYDSLMKGLNTKLKITVKEKV